MKGNSIRFFIPLVLAIIISVTSIGGIYRENVLAATLSEQKSQLSSLKDKYSKASENTRALKNKISAKRSQIKSLGDEKDVLDEEIGVLTEQVALAESLIEEYETAISEKEVEKSELEKKKENQNAMLADMLRMSYKYGEESYIDIILGAESISDFIQRLDFLAYHMRYSSTLLAEMKKTGDTLDEVHANLQSTVEAMRTVKTESEAAAKELSEKVTRADEIIAQLNADVSAMNADLAQKEADRKALENEVAQLTKAIQAQEAKDRENGKSTTPAYSGGMLGWPLKGYSMKYLTSSYGYRTDPITGRKGAFHNGLDVGAPHGTKILAAESGTVTRASTYGTYGKCVIISHGGGLMTLYAHCSGYNVVVGQQVNKGDVIAYVGSTGRSTGNHLHFTVFINGTTVDPGKYLS